MDEKEFGLAKAAQGTRRRVLQAGLATIAGVGLVAPQRAEAKIAQKAVQYIEASKRTNQNCANCVNFLAPNGCKIIDGEINPAGWCVVWAPAPKKVE